MTQLVFKVKNRAEKIVAGLSKEDEGIEQRSHSEKRSKSGRGQPHSKTLSRWIACQSFREVLECGCPLPLSLLPNEARLANQGAAAWACVDDCSGLIAERTSIQSKSAVPCFIDHFKRFDPRLN
jgi:hypothetical protein